MSIHRPVRGARLWLGLAVIALGAGCATDDAGELRAQARRANSHLDLGIDHLQNGRTALALREFLNAETLAPLNPRIQYALGEAYLARGKHDESELHLRRALTLHTEYQDARLTLSGLYLLQERWEEAIAECRILIDDPTFPTPWRALANQGWALYKLGRGAEARTSLEQALDFNARYWPALLNLAILEAQEGHRLEAIQRLRDTLALEPGARAEAEVNYRLAEIYISLGKRERAVSHLLAAVARAPEGEWGRKSEEYLKLLR